MNRSGDLLNSSRIGSIGKATRIYLEVIGWSSAQATSIITAGRRLVNTDPVSAVTSATVLVGRKLKVVAEGSVTYVSTLLKRIGIRLAAVSNPVATNEVLLKRISHVSMNISRECYFEYLSKITSAHPINTNVSTDLEAQTPSIRLLTARPLKSTQVLSIPNTVMVLSEANSLPAPLMRISFVLANSRVSVIPGK